jgi:RNA polymerase sigma-70 factor (ECF subfamily)
VTSSRGERDEDLMVRFQGGDRLAFAQLVRRHKAALFTFALRHVGTQPSAEEVVQEAFARIVQHAAEFRHESRFSTWIYRITRNLCVDELRKATLRRHPSLDEPGGGSDADGPTLGERTADSRANVERAAVSVEIRQRVADAIAQLPDEQREVFLLRELSNLPFKEIATIVGAQENTVKSRLRYALERLQEALCEFEEYARALR